MPLSLRPLPALLSLALAGCSLVERTVLDVSVRARPGAPGSEAEPGDAPWAIDRGGHWASAPSAGSDTGLGDTGVVDTGAPGPAGHGGFVVLSEFHAPCAHCFVEGVSDQTSAHAAFSTPSPESAYAPGDSEDACVDHGASVWATLVGRPGELDAGPTLLLEGGEGGPLRLRRRSAGDGSTVYSAGVAPGPRVGPGRALSLTLEGGADMGAAVLPGLLHTPEAVAALQPPGLLADDPETAFAGLDPGATLRWSPGRADDRVEVALFIYEPSGSHALLQVVICSGPDDGDMVLPGATLAAFDQHFAVVQVSRIAESAQDAPWDEARVQGIAVSTVVGTATLDSACGGGEPCPPLRSDGPGVALPMPPLGTARP